MLFLSVQLFKALASFLDFPIITYPLFSNGTSTFFDILSCGSYKFSNIIEILILEFHLEIIISKNHCLKVISGNIESPNSVILFESKEILPIINSSFSVLFINTPPICNWLPIHYMQLVAQSQDLYNKTI